MSAPQIETVPGGDINQAVRLCIGPRRYFVKTHAHAPEGFFRAEADGLQALEHSGLIRVPAVIAQGQFEDTAYLVLECLTLQAADRAAQQMLGRQLARLHRLPQPGFGGGTDNWIGATLQPNPDASNWVGFFREHRLLHQLRLAEQHGYPELIAKSSVLLDRLEALFESYRPDPSLLHGDLWSGNQAMDEAGQPVVFDPACYLGDRETDLAMTELFGGFCREFYDAYNDQWPLEAGYARRRDLYQLYHVLNHVNLFGRGYLGQAINLLARLRSYVAG